MYRRYDNKNKNFSFEKPRYYVVVANLKMESTMYFFLIFGSLVTLL